MCLVPGAWKSKQRFITMCSMTSDILTLVTVGLQHAVPRGALVSCLLGAET